MNFRTDRIYQIWIPNRRMQTRTDRISEEPIADVAAKEVAKLKNDLKIHAEGAQRHIEEIIALLGDRDTVQ